MESSASQLPGIVRSETRAPSWSSPYTPNKETRQVQPGTRLGPYEIVALLALSVALKGGVRLR
jgi:hypothetical protein